ncbi:MAG: GNAT family N-acetyltransferase [Chitinophagales bacterium]
MLFRKFASNDLHYYVDLMTNPKVTAYITGLALTKENANRRFQNVLNINARDEKAGLYVVFSKTNKVFVGLGKLVIDTNTQSEAEIGYALLPKVWGMGYGSEISQTLVDYVINFPQINTLTAIIDPANIASQKILLKSKFQLSHHFEMDKLPAALYTLSVN